MSKSFNLVLPATFTVVSPHPLIYKYVKLEYPFLVISNVFRPVYPQLKVSKARQPLISSEANDLLSEQLKYLSLVHLLTSREVRLLLYTINRMRSVKYSIPLREVSLDSAVPFKSRTLIVSTCSMVILSASGMYPLSTRRAAKSGSKFCAIFTGSSGSSGSEGSSGSTITSQKAVFPPSIVVTAIKAIPSLTALTFPSSSTVAIALSSLLHVTSLTVALSGVTVAIRVCVSPTFKVIDSLLRLTPVTATSRSQEDKPATIAKTAMACHIIVLQKEIFIF